MSVCKHLVVKLVVFLTLLYIYIFVIMWDASSQMNGLDQAANILHYI